MTPRIPWRTVRLYGLTALAGFVSAWLIVALLFLPASGPRDTVILPSVVGLSLEEARLVLDSAGLQFALGQERPSADVPRNSVLAQSPLPGAQVRRLSQVTLDVSTGPRSVRVPSVAGLTLEEARKVLSDSGLSAGAVRNEGSSAPRGAVLRTTPDAGRFVGERSAVELVVSAGPPDLIMPDVVGRAPADAMALLGQLGLTRIRVDSGATSGDTMNIVIAQQPAAGTGIRATDRVMLRLGYRP